MAHSPLFQQNYSPQFSGHETFPLRYGWLKKAFDAVEAAEGTPGKTSIFQSKQGKDEAIAEFGVGKNMVTSMRHWAMATGIIDESAINAKTFGRKLFAVDGLDPYMEHPSTLWLIHWNLASCSKKTTWFWAFNHFPASTFEREHFVKGLARLAKERGWPRVASATIKNDVACFIRTYVAQTPSARSGSDDALESPLTELGLIKAIGKRDGFRFVRGAKSTLGLGVFIYALLDFWHNYSANSATLSFEAIAYGPGSPGRVFLLDDNEVVDRLASLDETTGGALQWSETAGLKQVLRENTINLEEESEYLEYIDMDYACTSDGRKEGK